MISILLEEQRNKIWYKLLTELLSFVPYSSKDDYFWSFNLLMFASAPNISKVIFSLSVFIYWFYQLRHCQPPLLSIFLPPPITKTIQVRRTRHAGHCWKNRDELIRDVLLWTPAHVRAKAGRPARTYIQQLCEDTGCCPEDLPRAMNDREEWRERVRDIRATSAT